jgi:hypothetical protein
MEHAGGELKLSRWGNVIVVDQAVYSWVARAVAKRPKLWLLLIAVVCP